MGAELRDFVKALPVNFSAVDLKDPSEIASLRLTICAILLKAAKQITLQLAFEPKQTVQAATAYMNSHLAETASVEDVADAIHCCRAKLFQVFKDSTGMTPNDYWQRLRIDRSQEMLSRSSKSIKEIAMDCGFSTSQYFSTVFRKYSGVSPSQYRAIETVHKSPSLHLLSRHTSLDGVRSPTS